MNTSKTLGVIELNALVSTRCAQLVRPIDENNVPIAKEIIDRFPGVTDSVMLVLLELFYYTKPYVNCITRNGIHFHIDNGLITRDPEKNYLVITPAVRDYFVLCDNYGNVSYDHVKEALPDIAIGASTRVLQQLQK